VRHFLLAALYSACVAAFFAMLLRDDLRSGLRLFLGISGVMLGGVFVLGWLMMLLG
jgi:hypothetical protein